MILSFAISGSLGFGAESVTFTNACVLDNLSGSILIPGTPENTPVPYNFTYAASMVSSNLRHPCGAIQNSPFSTPWLTNVVRGGESYPVIIEITASGEICDAPQSPTFDSGKPACFDAVVEQTSLYYSWPFPGDASPMKSWSVFYRRNSNSVPLAKWELKDDKGKQITGEPQKGVYHLPADGMATAQATIVVNISENVSWTFAGDNLGCSLTSGGLLTAGTNEGTVQVTGVITNTDPCIERDFYFELGSCVACPAGDCTAQAANGSVDLRFNLGPSLKTPTPSFLRVQAGAPTTDLGNPTLLKCPYWRPDLEKMTNDATGWLRQVRSLKYVVDVITNSASSYSLKFYSSTNVTGSKSNGLYLFRGSPFQTFTIELVGGDTNQVRLTDSLDSSVTDYVWETNGWALVTGNGLRRETKLVSWSGAVRTETTSIKNASNVTDRVTVQKWQTNSFGDRLIEEVLGSGAAAQTNSYTYDSNGGLYQVTRGDGSWDIYVHDSLGRQIEHYSPFLNSAPTTNSDLCRLTASTYTNSVVPDSGDDSTLEPFTPRRVIESIKGSEVGRRYTVVKSGERRDIRCVTTGALWDDTNNLVTVTYVRTDSLHLGKPHKVLHPDGTAKLMAYTSDTFPGPVAQGSINCEKTTIWSGTLDSWGEMPQGTKEDTLRNSAGKIVRRDVRDLFTEALLSSETNWYDFRGRLTNTVFLNGTRVVQAYDCCGVSSRAETDLGTTTFTYDSLKRVVTSTRGGITLSNVYNAAGDILAVYRFGTNGNSIRLTLAGYDTAGRITATTNALNHFTTYSESVDAGGETTHTTTFPNLSTRIEVFNRDGSRSLIGGTAVRSARWEYGPTNNGTYTTEVKRTSDDVDTSESIIRILDMIGRPSKELFPGDAANQSFYGTNGLLSKTIDPDGVTSLYEYDAFAKLEYMTVDMNRNGVKEFSGADRIAQNVSDITSNYDTYVRRTRTFVWPDSSETPYHLATVEISANGLSTWNTLFNAGQSIPSSTCTFYTNGHRYVTNILFDGTVTIRDFQNGRLLSETRKGLDGNQIAATTYEYDEHGRLKKSIDARNGATTFTYDDADRLTSVTPPSPTSGSGPPTMYFYDSMGRVTNVALPPAGIGPIISTEYHLTGEVATNWGYTTPVAYTYDYAGRLKTMTTWTNFAKREGPAVTTWNYDGYRGFLTNKTYAATNGPSYSYTKAGRLKSRTWARDITCTYVTNAAGDIVEVSYTGGTSGYTTTFDRLGRPFQVNQGTNVTVLAYNDVGQLVGETFNGFVVTNKFNSLLLRTNLQFLISASPQFTNTFVYDAAARLAQVSDGTHSVAYQYEAHSSLISTQIFRQGGTPRMTVTNWWDFWNRPAHHASMPTADVSVKHYMGHDSLNRVTGFQREDSIGGIQALFSYDALGQLTSANRTWWLAGNRSVAGQQFEYGHDDIGNRRWAASGGNEWGKNLRMEHYTPNGLNQYTKRTVPGWINVIGAATNTATVTVNNQSTSRSNAYFRAEIPVNNLTNAVWLGMTNIGVLNVGTNYDLVTTNIGYAFVPATPEIFQYDADGNLMNDGRWTLTWDAENRLIRMESFSNAPAASRLTLEFGYDYRGRRTSKTVSNWSSGSLSHTKFVYDDWNLIAELNGTNNAIVNTYMWGPDLSSTMQGAGGVGGLLAINAGTNGVHFAAQDGKGGNVVALVNAADGTVSAQYDYGPFGEAIRVQGVAAKLNPIRFSSKYRDEETDWVYYGRRYYTPGSGRWTSKDPIGEAGGPKLDMFVHNDPVSRIDPLGLQAAPIDFSVELFRLAPPEVQQMMINAVKKTFGFGFFQGAQHWFLAGGQDKHVPFSQYDPGWGAKDFPGFEEAVRNVCGCCGESFGWSSERTRHLYSEGLPTIFRIGGPGTYTLRIDGRLSSEGTGGGCRWRYEGDVTIPPDPFDFNPLFLDTHRNLPGEAITIIIWYMHNFGGWGADFRVVFDGSRHVNETGDCPN